MSTAMQIPAGEHGVIRLFEIDARAEPPVLSAAPEGAPGAIDPPWPLRDALGVAFLDADFIELIALSDLGDIGLAGYLVQGLGIAQTEVDPLIGRLDALKGHVLIVFSEAFGGHAATVTARAPLKWVGTFVEDKDPVVFETLPSESAQRQDPAAKPRKELSDAAIGGRVATVALLVAFGVAAMMVWLA